MTDRVPFGFRPDVEDDKAEPPEEARKEVNNTTCSTSATWTPVIRTAAAARDLPFPYQPSGG